MALPISSELRLLLVERDDLSTLLEQLEDLSQRLDTVEGTLRTDVELVNGSGFSVEGVVEDIKTVVVAAGVEDLFLTLPIDQAKTFVRQRIEITRKKIKPISQSIDRLQKEHELVSQALQQALQSPQASSA